MGTAVSRNNHKNIDDISSSLDLRKSIMHSRRLSFKSNKYLSYSLIDNYPISNLFSAANGVDPLLPEDILQLEILTRLPVRSLIRFLCVCKSWQSFISSGDPSFIKSHLAHIYMDPDNDYVIVKCHLAARNTPKRNFHHPLLLPDIKVAGSVNGLVCVYRYSWTSESIICIGIWNPVTKQYKDIPLPPATIMIQEIGYSLGICFDPIADDYKLICVTRIYDRPLVAHVYSCNAGSWSKIKVTSTFISSGKFSKPPITVGGRLYWINYDRPDAEHFVMSFDVTQEVFKLLPGLDFMRSSDQYGGMTNLRDSLAAIVYGRGGTTMVDVYIFDETISSSSCGGGGWSKKYTIGPITLTKKMCFFQSFWNGDLLFKDKEQFKLVCIDTETHKIKGLYSASYTSRYLGSFVYIETLASVKGMQRVQVDIDESDILFIQR